MEGKAMEYIEKQGCPFCGGTDIFLDTVSVDDQDGFYYFCLDCYADGPMGNSRAEAAEKWNKRTEAMK